MRARVFVRFGKVKAKRVKFVVNNAQAPRLCQWLPCRIRLLASGDIRRRVHCLHLLFVVE